MSQPRVLAENDLISGLLLVHQRTPVSSIIESPLLIWAASEAEDWIGQTASLPL
jgi:hypothetical protein